MMRSIFWICLAVAVIACGTAAAKDAPLRVLVFSGLNNHDWKSTTPVLLDALKKCGRFGVVDVTDDPGKCDAAQLARYDVIVSNWTPYPRTAREWSGATEKAFLDFVRNGGGFLVIHAAACTYQEWPEFQKVIGLTWQADKTSHTHYSTFKVGVKDAKHPIVRGLTDFYTTDELYQNMVCLTDNPFKVVFDAYSAKSVNGTEKNEPMLITMQYGKGRAVNLMLGHDAPAMRNVGFQTLLLRGTEWAASGRVTIPAPKDWPSSHAAGCVSGIDTAAAVETAKSYRRNEDRAALAVVENLVAAATSRKEGAALAALLADALKGDATPDAKALFCRELGSIGTEREVPAIAALLSDEAVEPSARRVLEQISGDAADRALLDALSQASPKLAVGIINSLGERRTRGAVSVLVARLNDTDPEITTASAAALGKIGGKECAAPLREALAKAPAEQRAALAEACMNCAARLGGAEAGSLYKSIEDGEVDAPTRAAAWLARAKLSGAAGVAGAAQSVQGQDRLLREAALHYLREAPGPAATHTLTGLLKNAEPGLSVLVLAALSDRGDAKSSKEVLPLAGHAEEAVRIAAIKALARIGTAEAVPVLLERAAHAEGTERDAARMSLDRLNTRGANAALKKSATDKAPELRMETMRALAGRKAVALLDVALNATADPDPRVREEAWKTLRMLADRKHLPVMQDRLKATNGTERAVAEEAISAVAK